MQIKVFIGSASENTPHAKDVADLLSEEGVYVIGWWDETVFRAGTSILDSLQSAAKLTNAALMVAGKDDLITSRGAQHWSPRDNVVFEYGLFAGTHGAGRAALAVIRRPDDSDPQLPSDLAGIVTIRLTDAPIRAEFMRLNRPQIRRWIEDISSMALAPPAPPLPLLWETMLRVLGQRKDLTPEWRREIDQIASDLLEPLVSAFGEDFGINDSLTEAMTRGYLDRCTGIHAIDVLGPQGWVSPSSYRYLSHQIREYLNRNMGGSAGFELHLTPQVAAAVRRAVQNAKSWSVRGKDPFGVSRTEFADTTALIWSEGNAGLEFVRILLWGKDELLSSVAESMITIHEAFHIPLFFIETSRQDPLRDFDYLYFKMPQGSVEGYFGAKDARYRTEQIYRGGAIPQMGSAPRRFLSLLEDPNLMFATDARAILRRERNRA